MWYEGYAFTGNMNKFRSYACKVGWMTQIQEDDVFIGYKAVQMLKSEFNDHVKEPIVYSFIVHKDLPLNVTNVDWVLRYYEDNDVSE